MTPEEYFDLCAADPSIMAAHRSKPEKTRATDGLLDIPIGLSKHALEPIHSPENFMMSRNFHHGRVDAGSAKPLSREFPAIDALSFVNESSLKRANKGRFYSREKLEKKRVPDDIIESLGVKGKGPFYYKNAEMDDLGIVNLGKESLDHVSNGGRDRIGVVHGFHDYRGNPKTPLFFSRVANNLSYGAGYGYGKGEIWLARQPVTPRVSAMRKRRAAKRATSNAGFAGRENNSQ